MRKFLFLLLLVVVLLPSTAHAGQTEKLQWVIEHCAIFYHDEFNRVAASINIENFHLFYLEDPAHFDIISISINHRMVAAWNDYKLIYKTNNGYRSYINRLYGDCKL